MDALTLTSISLPRLIVSGRGKLELRVCKPSGVDASLNQDFKNGNCGSPFPLIFQRADSQIAISSIYQKHISITAIDSRLIDPIAAHLVISCLRFFISNLRGIPPEKSLVSPDSQPNFGFARLHKGRRRSAACYDIRRALREV